EELSGPEGIVGTPAYMSPEQANAERLDGRSDIYSLGVVLYELLCGRSPFADNVVCERLRRVREEEPPPPRQLVPEIPRELEAVCLKAMAKRVSDRYSTAADFAADLRSCLAGSPITSGLTKDQGAIKNPLHLIWDSLDSNLQHAFSLAYNKKRREGS